MSSRMNQQTVVERIDLYLTDDMPVSDSNSEEIGHVKMFSTVAGYLIVGHGPFEKDSLYIPFRLIQSIDPRELFLSEPKQTVVAGYTTPPPISTFTEQRLVRTAEGGLKSESRQVQMVRSGYDGLPARINSVVDTDSIAHRLAVGMAVYDASGARLGDVTQYDAARSLFSVESRILFVPFSAIQTIGGAIAIPQLLRRGKGVNRALKPGGAVELEDAMPVRGIGEEQSQRLGVAFGLLYAFRRTVIVGLGLDDGERVARLVEEQVVGALGFGAGRLTPLDEDTPSGEDALFADLLIRPASSRQLRQDILAAGIRFARHGRLALCAVQRRSSRLKWLAV
jgi:hypothetical protein